MGMFGSLAKAAVGACVDTPLSAAADLVTLGGVATDRDGPYTVSALGRVKQNVEDAAEPDGNHGG